MKLLIKIHFILLLLVFFFITPLPTFATAPSNGTWIPVGNMATRHILSASTLLQNGKVLVAGGQPSGGNPNTFEPLIDFTELYDPGTRTWSTTGNLNTPRMIFDSPYHIMVTLQNGKALIAGGMDTNFNSIGSAELYDPTTGTWSYTGSLNTSRRDLSMVLLNDGRVLVAGGATGAISGIILATSELYDPTTDTWSYTTNNLVTPRDGATTIKLKNGRVLIVGGNQADATCTNTAEIFDPTKNTWSSAGTMPFGGDMITTTLLSDGRVFITRGTCGTYTADAAIYDPVANTWTATSSIPVFPVVNSFLLENGKILMRSGSPEAGNTTVGTVAPVDEIYDPATNTWSVTNLPLGGNNGGTYTQLANGEVLAMGGWDCDPSNPSCTLNTAELFTASSNDLSVPLLKQTDAAWGAQEYDSGNRWAGVGHGNIANYGCAMTSAAMILEYYGITKLPDNTALDPGSLNTWLKNQPDGYVGDGLINWLAISRLAKVAKNKNPNFIYDALEFKRANSADTAQLTTDINNKQPDILEEPGHFIVGKGINGNTFDINDPYYSRNDLTNGYNNSFLSLARYIPAHSDLSYIMLTVNPDVTITVKTNGNSIGEQFIQQPYADPLNQNIAKGHALKIVYIPKPSSGNYQVTLSGTTAQAYQFNAYLYDQQGNVNPFVSQGTLSQNLSDAFTLNFNNQNTNSSIITRIVSFQSFIDDVNENVALQQINKAIGNAFIPLIISASESENKGQKTAARLKLDAIQVSLYLLRGKGILESAFQILLYDITYLKNHL